MSRLFQLTVLLTVFSGGFAHAQTLGAPGLLGESSEDAHSPETEIAGKKIKDVSIAGNKRVASDDIRVSIKTRPGMIFDSDRLARDIRSLYALGFFSDIQVHFEPMDEGVELIFTVKEKPAINKIILEGDDEVNDDDILEVIDLKNNEPLDIPNVHKNVQKVRDIYSEKGFFLAQVGYKLEEAGENSYDVTIEIEENAQVQVRRISFVGNHEISDIEIARFLATRTAGPLSFLTDSGKFKKEDFNRDLTIISALYWDRGYLDVQVGTPQVELSPDRSYIYLAIPIEEGPRYRVGRIQVVEKNRKGEEIKLLGGRRKVRGMVFTKREEWFSRTSVVEDIDRITRFYQDRGYAHVNIDLKTLPRQGENIVDIVFDISRGDMVYFERVDIRGNTKTRDRVIRREVVIHEGERYSQTGIDISKARVTALGFFETVEVTTSQGSAPDQMRVTVEVTERHTGQFQIGMGFSSIESFIVQGQVTEQNFLGHGQTVSLQLQMSSMRRIFTLNWWEPHFLDTNWTAAFSLFNTVMAQIDYERESTGGDVTLGHTLGLRDLRFYGTYRLEYDKINTGSNSGLLIAGQRLDSDLRDLPLAHLFKEGLSSSLKGRITFDKRNNRLFPTDGSLNEIAVEWASPYIGSDFGFTRYTLTSRWYIPIVWKFVFRFNAVYGLIHAHGPEGLAIVHRYRSGGIMDVRGFYPWSLGPKLSIPSSFDPNAEPTPYGINIGGNMKLTLNSEIEFPIVEMAGIKGVVFFDAGNSFNLEENWCSAGGGRGINQYTDPCNKNPFVLRTSWGFGFRWFSPMGPLRFEWGFPTFTIGAEESHMFQFTFGNFF